MKTVPLLFLFLFSGSAQSADISVAVVAADYSHHLFDVEAKISPYVKSVKLYQLDRGTPYYHLLNVDAVLTWETLPARDPRAYGNLLANLVDGGIGVVQSLFVRSKSGRFYYRDYPAFLPAQKWWSGALIDLGKIYAPQHPILRGVKSVGRNKGLSHPPHNAVHKRAKTLALWNNGRPLVVIRTDTPAPVVGLGFNPVSSDQGKHHWNVHSDTARLMVNALLFAARKKIPVGGAKVKTKPFPAPRHPPNGKSKTPSTKPTPTPKSPLTPPKKTPQYDIVF